MVQQLGLEFKDLLIKEPEAMPAAEKREVGKWVQELSAVFTDPLVMHPGGWGDGIDKRIKESVITERLVELMSSRKEDRPITGTDAEVLIYLSTASMDAPLCFEYTNIMQWVFTRVVGQFRDIPDDLRQESLSLYERQELADLRRKIYNARLKHRKKESYDRKTADIQKNSNLPGVQPETSLKKKALPPERGKTLF